MTAPATLDDLLAILPGLRRLRSLDADLLRILLDRRPKTCTWCNRIIGGGRRTWCSNECVNHFKLRCDPAAIRRYVEVRDEGICQICKRDTLAAEREGASLTRSTSRFRLVGESDVEYGKRQRDNEATLANLGFSRGAWREVDHKVAVVEYGGLAEVSGMRLLCGACHDEQTKQLSRRRMVR